MRKAQDLVGRDVISQTTGERLAMVRDVLFDNEAHQVVALLVDTGGWFSEAKVIQWQAVVSAGDVIVVSGATPVGLIKNDPVISELLQVERPMIGNTLISSGGEEIGSVGALFIDDAGRVVGYEVKQGFISDLGGRKFLPVGDVHAVGKDAIIADAAHLVALKDMERDDRAAQQATEHVAQIAEAPRGDDVNRSDVEGAKIG